MITREFSYSKPRQLLGALVSLGMTTVGVYYSLAFFSDLVPGPASNRRSLEAPVVALIGFGMLYFTGSKLFSQRPALKVSSKGIEGHVLGRWKLIEWSDVLSVRRSESDATFEYIYIESRSRGTKKLGIHMFGNKRFDLVYSSLHESLESYTENKPASSNEAL